MSSQIFVILLALSICVSLLSFPGLSVMVLLLVSDVDPWIRGQPIIRHKTETNGRH